MSPGATPSGAILFDFDGTLVDTREASWELFAETNARFGLGVDTRDAFFDIFQGNFHRNFDALSDDKDLIGQAKAHFEAALRSRYQPRVIPGMVDVIKALTPTYTLAVVSSNTMPAIRRCLDEAQVATCFGHVFSGDIAQSKSAVIERFMADQSYATLRHCVPAYVDSAEHGLPLAADNVFLVTDTVGDVEEANRVGVRAIGVCWGMHDEASLLAAGAEAVMVWPQELVAHLATHGTIAETGAVPDSCRPDPPPTASPPTTESASIRDAELYGGTCGCCSQATPEDSHRAARPIRVAARVQARRSATANDHRATTPAEPPDRPHQNRAPHPGRAARSANTDRELVAALTRTAVP